jgi:two-component system cell cycle response regulator
MQFGDKIRRISERTPFKFEDTEIPVTVSVGVAVLTSEAQDAAAFVKSADDNLYAAKAAGRNQVVG